MDRHSANQTNVTVACAQNKFSFKMRLRVLGLVAASIARAFAEFIVLRNTAYNSQIQPLVLALTLESCIKICQESTCSIAVHVENEVSRLYRLISPKALKLQLHYSTHP